MFYFDHYINIRFKDIIMLPAHPKPKDKKMLDISYYVHKKIICMVGRIILIKVLL